jgi:glucose-1-phosphate adenylyltransferase
MGIYLFNKKVLFDILERFDYDDFGKHIIPSAIANYNVYAYPFTGYWEDIGTIRSFFDAHMALTLENPPFNFYDQEKPIFTHARFLPAAKISGATINSSIISEGAMIERAVISDSVIGLRSIIRQGSVVSRTVLMGADHYETEQDGVGGLGIGRDCQIKNAIIDKDVSIGNAVQLMNRMGIQEGEQDGIVIKDGIIVVPKGMRIPDSFVL